MFKYVVLFTALLLASITATFSVIGISSLYINSIIAARCMAVGLELGKLVAVSFIYRYWSKLKGIFKYYFVMASIILMGITSFGVYSYLEAAYAGAASQINQKQLVISSIETQELTIKNRIDQLNKNILQLQTTRIDQENRSNQLIGKVGFITQQRISQQTNRELENNQTEINKLNESYDSLENIKLTQKNNIITSGKIGTFSYVAQILGIKLDTLVLWFSLIIVFVFDPLAVSLIIAYNFIIKNENNKEEPIIEIVSDEIKKEIKTEEIQKEYKIPPGGISIAH